MGDFEGHDVPGRRHPVESAAKSAVLQVLSRGAMFVVVGVLVWGFNRMEQSQEKQARAIEDLNKTLINIMVDQGVLKTRVDMLERAGMDRRAP